MNETKKPAGRRSFLVRLLTGAGAVAALAGAPRSDAARKEAPAVEPSTILYRRTEDVERYYRTLYR
jgi:hypothetical protein